MKTQEQRNAEASKRTNGAISTQAQRRAEHMANQKESMAKNARESRPRSVNHKTFGGR